VSNESPEVVVEELAGLQRRLVAELETRGRGAIAERGQFIIALPGGSVAKTFFPAFADADNDWSRTEFFWIDERAVPPDDPESNYALASTLWLTPARVPPPRIHRLRGEDADLNDAAQLATQELVAIAGDPPRLDLALLGVGEDGHIASIFPGREIRTDSPFVPVHHAPKPPPRRLTLTMPVLSEARHVVIVALGRLKAAAVRDALSAEGVTPLAELLRRSRSALVLLDPDAASLTTTS
jgi:6-phosphogluconolactonase